MSIMDNSSRIAGSFFISVPLRLAWLSLIVLICSLSHSSTNGTITCPSGCGEQSTQFPHT